MHPKQIVEDFQKMGATFAMEGNELYLNNSDQVSDEMKVFAKSFKSRLVMYLQGNYTDAKHNVYQTIDKLIDYMKNTQIENQTVIDRWLSHDQLALDKTVKLMQSYRDNGWTNFDEPVANFENKTTEELAAELYNRAMDFVRGVAS
ncbi:hypothetical protein [Alkalicoccobacillus plakortidis]|uniref:HEPN domain-containing protein n=1 Tax=Alkalicoccobacillus plakortidis TaxID=444060 RepID=A0ABT0XI80_9BACI|nr:hypothetical protein [Alkalicoccobacillus plakortidis]MCM2675594.1 hypothetical protein [Alkalicoccobacillus plakortidis]